MGDRALLRQGDHLSETTDELRPFFSPQTRFLDGTLRPQYHGGDKVPSISTTVPLYFAKCSPNYHITCEWSRNYYPCIKNVKKRGVGVPFSDVSQITHMPSESYPPAF